MSFKITSQRPAKVQKRISAFDEAGAEQQDGDVAAGSTSQAASEALAVSARKWIDKGTEYAEAGNAQAALRCWDQAALIQPRNSRLHEMRAQVLDQAGRTFEAVQAAQQAVSLEPDWVEGHITLARVQLNLGEPQLALASYMAAAKLQPGHPDLVQEMPNAQMLAKMHQQQPKGTRAHVVEGSSDAAAAAAAAAGAEAIVQEEVEAAEAGGTGDEHMSATAVAAAAVPNSDAQAAAAAEPAGAAAAVTEGAAAADALVQGSSAQQAHEGTQQPSAAAGADQHSSEAS